MRDRDEASPGYRCAHPGYACSSIACPIGARLARLHSSVPDGVSEFTSGIELAGVVQWQNGSFPSCIRGFDSLRPLQTSLTARLAAADTSLSFATDRA